MLATPQQNTDDEHTSETLLSATTRWHSLDPEEFFFSLKTSPEGLSTGEAEARQAIHGRNVLADVKQRGPLLIFFSQFADFMVIVLIGAAIIAGFLGEPEDIIAISAIVFLNAILGFFQEFRAEKALAALKRLSAPMAKIKRNREIVTQPASELVPGDIVLIEAGNLVPADLRLLETVQLTIDESMLTGESAPVEKNTDTLEDKDLQAGDKTNITFKGTIVSYGRATGVVVATGMNTELGKIATLLREEKELKTPLQRRLSRFAQRLALFVLLLCGVLFAVGLLRGEKPLLMFLTALSLAVAAIPEALPAVVTVSLALGARRMAKRNALIRKLPAVEALGSVTFICTDKTGTLTENKMAVQAYSVSGKEETGPSYHSAASNWDLFFKAMALNNDATRNSSEEIQGDPTEAALLLASEKHGFEKDELSSRYPRVAEIPFSSERSLMSTIHQHEGVTYLFSKGAAERVLEICDSENLENETRSLDGKKNLSIADNMASRGLRVLGIAYRELPSDWESFPLDQLEKDLTFLGLVGMWDPPREEARESVALCHSAGIHVVMITGDYPATAKAIAVDLGIIQKGGRVLSGQELTALSDEALNSLVAEVRVYARVSPDQKIRLVKALQGRGEVCSMTGDGVNDAPALRRADIGVAMGKSGTDVAREAAHMVLLDDNFATIVSAVKEGRRIYDNIRKFVRYALTGNSGEIWALLLAPMVGLPIPLLPIQILWVNLVTDGLPGIALSLEKEERGIMERKPRPFKESIFSHGLWQHAGWIGLLLGGVTLLTQAWAYHTGSAHWQSMTFTVLTLSQMGHVLAIRSERNSLFSIGIFSNLPLLGAVVITFILQLATLYIPFLQPIFHTEALTLGELGLCLAISTVIFWAVEIEKWMVRKRGLYQNHESDGIL